MTSNNATKPSAIPAGAEMALCSCGGGHSPACTCCRNICFERPRYFCGQLLNDADLSTEQAYIREKQKLYHRTLHGYGVVCGLRLTCDQDCGGHVRVGDGYAIDDCGNDIVVCQPASFDVIAALKAKNWLIPEPTSDPCKDKDPPHCKVKQCFYVTICYDEEPAEFTTPFKTNCGPGAAACEPTRIKETYRFDVLKKPPNQRNYLDDLEERITCCWKIFTDGPLARTLQTHFDKNWTRDTEKEYCAIFCQLQVLFKHHLQQCPDRYDCTLYEQVCRLECPPKDSRTWERAHDAFCQLFQLIIRYIFNCILGEMIFACPSPAKSQCVGLGTVEVEDCKIVRVCNCPRSYVWTFANFFEVLLATIVGGAACASHGGKIVTQAAQAAANSGAGALGEREQKDSCCAPFLIDCDQFMTLYRSQPHFGRFAAAAPVDAARRAMAALKTGFNFTDALAFSPRIFEGLSGVDAEALAKNLTVQGRDGTLLDLFLNPTHFQAADPIAAILGCMLKRSGDDLAATLTDDKANIATVVPRSQVLPPPLQSLMTDTRVKAAEDKAAAAQAAADALTAQVNDLKGQIASLRDQLRPPAGPATPPAGGVV
jgi:hypothetical protein